MKPDHSQKSLEKNEMKEMEGIIDLGDYIIAFDPATEEAYGAIAIAEKQSDGSLFFLWTRVFKFKDYDMAILSARVFLHNTREGNEK